MFVEFSGKTLWWGIILKLAGDGCSAEHPSIQNSFCISVPIWAGLGGCFLIHGSQCTSRVEFSLIKLHNYYNRKDYSFYQTSTIIITHKKLMNLLCPMDQSYINRVLLSRA